MKYLFNNVEFDPDAKPQIVVNGVAQKSYGQKPIEVLQYLLDNNGQMKERDEIIANVWGKDDASKTSYEALSVACARANRSLAGACRIDSVRGTGYRIKVDLTKVSPPQNQTVVIHEKVSLHKPTLMICVFTFIFILLVMFGLSRQQLTPVSSAAEAPSYTLKGTDAVFMANKALSRPLLSPDGNYVAHTLLNKTNKEGFLAITELATGKTTKLAGIRFEDGFRWNMTGDKIVYQTRINKKCEVRLAHLNLNKTLAEDELLSHCEQNSGRLSFAWFNEYEFYFNLVDTTTAKGLPLHQLYSFNVETKTETKELSTLREGGVGFYSLEYDSANKALYMLKINRQFTSDVYRYQNGQLEKLTTAEQLIYYYGVFNGRLAYVNHHNELVLSQSATDLTRNKVILPSIKVPIYSPNVVDDRLAFLAGHLFSYALHKVTNSSVNEVDLAGYIPDEVASHNNLLVFTSKQTGINQIYKQLANGTIVQLSDFTQHAIIEHISIVSDLIAVSHINRVDFYYIKDNKLAFINSLSGFSDGVLSKNGKIILATQVDTSKNEQNGDIVELQLIDFAPTGLVFNNASTAIYGSQRYSEILYINNKQQLVRFYNGKHQVLQGNIAVKNANGMMQHNNYFYYVAQDTQKLMGYDFASQKVLDIDLAGFTPRNIVVIDGELLIVTKKAVAPKLMIGQLVVNE